MHEIIDDEVNVVSGGLQMLDDIARQAGRDLGNFMNSWDSVSSSVSQAWAVRFNM